MSFGGYIITQQDGTTRTIKHRGTVQMLVNAGDVTKWEKDNRLQLMNRDEIRALASEHDIPGRGRMNKDQLIAALEAL